MMFKISYNILRHTKSSLIIPGYLRLNNLASIPITATTPNIENEEITDLKPSNIPYNNTKQLSQSLTGHSLIAAAFSMLNDNKASTDIKTPFTDERISKAKTVDELLSVSDGTGVSRRLALKIISVLSDWATSGKIDMQKFESDPRFIRLCSVLTKSSYVGKANNLSNSVSRNEDLTTILGITAEEDAAKLMCSISLPHMVRVMSFLAVKHNRSTTLLRTIAFSISGKAEHLSLKHCADVLYSSAVLNFIDENLLEKVCRDIFSGLEYYDQGSPVIASILTGLGVLRYKNPGLLDALSSWVFKYQNKCRPHDIFALFMTLGILNHRPRTADELYKVLLPQLNLSDAKKASVWLDIVWSLVILNQATPEHIASVLSESFIIKLMGDVSYSNGTKLKLLNIDSACDLLFDNYTGPRIPNGSSIKTAVLSQSKNKENMVNLVLDSLSSLLNPKTHMKTNIDTKMGFYIDAEIALDNRHNLVPLDHSNSVKVAVLAYDFHDLCHGHIEQTGFTALNIQLLEAQGYKILEIPYTEFSISVKFINRVKYLESRIKTLSLN